MKKFFLFSFCFVFSTFQALASSFTWLGTVEQLCDTSKTINNGTYSTYTCPDNSTVTCQCSSKSPITIDGNSWPYCNWYDNGGSCKAQKLNPKLCKDGSVGMVVKTDGWGNITQIMGCQTYTLEGVNGSWNESCTDPQLDALSGEFSASCPTGSKKIMMTKQYNLHDCWTGNIWYGDGKLQCDEKSPASPQDTASKEANAHERKSVYKRRNKAGS
jgi:hypothetical protein